MSQAPSVADVPPGQQYIDAFMGLSKMLRKGRSFSGHERNCCFLNTRGGIAKSSRFANISAVSGFDFPEDGRAIGLVDWDHDGDLDVWVTNRTGPQVRFLRNNTDRNHHWLAVRLRGSASSCNRDAIGARVELYLHGETEDDQSVKLIRTLRAGEGYLGQHSKWIHFGLGRMTRVDRLVVRWPDGKVDELGGLPIDARYLVTQNSGRAERWTRPDPFVRLRSSELPVQSVRDPSRIALVQRVPVPELIMGTLDEQWATMRGMLPDDGPILLNLWASWCPPCLRELRDWTRHESKLTGAGLRILAVNVDAQRAGGGASPAAIRKMLKEMTFPFSAGLASADLVAKLDLMHDVLFSRSSRLPVAFQCVDRSARKRGCFLSGSGGR